MPETTAYSLRTGVTRFTWSAFNPKSALLPLPAILISVVTGLATGHPSAGLVAGGGAQTAGFGSFQKPMFFPGGAILAATVGMAASATLGCLAGGNTALLILLGIVWAFCYGMAGAISNPAQWVLQQCCTFLVVSSAFHGTVESAFLRGAGVLAGGTLQFLSIRLFWRVWSCPEQACPDPANFPPGWRWDAVRQNLSLESPIFRFALRLSAIAAVSIAVYRALHFQNAYWIPMTALLIPKPDRASTIERDVARIAGTIAGAGVATIIAVAIHPQLWMTVVLIEVFMWAAYALQNVNYAFYVVMLTGYIAFLLSIAHQPEQSTVWHRMLATEIGGVITLAAYGIHISLLAKTPQLVSGGQSQAQ